MPQQKKFRGHAASLLRGGAFLESIDLKITWVALTVKKLGGVLPLELRPCQLSLRMKANSTVLKKELEILGAVGEKPAIFRRGGFSPVAGQKELNGCVNRNHLQLS